MDSDPRIQYWGGEAGKPADRLNLPRHLKMVVLFCGIYSVAIIWQFYRCRFIF